LLDTRDKRFLGQGIFAWLFLPLAVIFNALLEKMLMQPLLGREMGELAGVASLITLIFITAYLLLKDMERPSSCRVSFLLGAIWVGLALALDMIILLLTSGEPGEMANLSFSLRGRMFSLMLAILFLSPVICSSTLLRR
jgi:hypothetical protein